MNHPLALALALAGTCLLATLVHAGQAPAVEPKVEPLPLSAVRLTDGPLRRAQDLDHQYLLELEPDRMMAYPRERAGLEPKAEPYGGWDGAGRQLTGHIAGHYLSAVSLMYAATGNEELKRRADYLVSEMMAVQNARGTGYIGAILGNDRRRGDGAASAGENDLVDGEELFGRIAVGTIESGGFDLNGMWAPWYVQHKLFAGLRDAHGYAGNADALAVEVRFAEWVESVVGELTDEQAQQMLRTEFGGMNEVLIDLYADTGDERWLALSEKFRDDSLIDPIAGGENVLPGKHGNTQVPKFVGSLDRHVVTGDEAAGAAARNFWRFVVNDHTFATGGHGYDEYFGPADALSGQIDGTGQRSRSLRTAESCNVYNMLKLTRGLFAVEPRPEYADFHERALFNHALSSIHPTRGEVCYMVPVGPGVTREYSGKFDSFTCCVGTGMESHALHGDGIYHVRGDERIWVSLYAASTAEWEQAGVRLTVETDMPLGDTATLALSMDEPKQFTLSLRRPAWAGQDFAIKVNGEAVADLGEAGSFVDVTHEWSDGDTIEIALPHPLRAEPLADNPDRVAIFYGPLVLAGDFGEGRRREALDTFPAFAQAGRPLADWLKPVEGEPGTYTAELATGDEITLSPFYALHDHRYSIYFDVLTPEQWSQRQAALDAEEAARRAIDERTIAYVQLGEMQPERDFNYRDEGTEPFRNYGQPGRRGGKWMAVDVPLDGRRPGVVSLAVSERSDRDDLVVVAGDTTLRRPQRRAEEDERVVTLDYPIPDGVAVGESLTIRIAAPEGEELPAIYGIRVMTAGEAEPTDLGIENGVSEHEVGPFRLKLVDASQTVAALEPIGVEDGWRGEAFDYTPADQIPARSENGHHHLGDVGLVVRQGDSEWRTFDSAANRRPVEAINISGQAIAGADITASMGEDCPVRVVRTWTPATGGGLAMHVELTNATDAPVTIGGLEFPAAFNNMIFDFTRNRPRSLEEAHAACSFVDPYIGRDAGYLQVVRLKGTGPALLVLPDADYPTPLEAFRPVPDRSPLGQTFEGVMSWVVYSQAWAETEWRDAQPWNEPTSVTLQPGESIGHGLRFVLADGGVRDIDATLKENRQPVALGVPGYIVPTGEAARLYLDPAGRSVASITSEPAEALSVAESDAAGDWQAFDITANNWGRSRLTVSYDDGTEQTVHYYATEPWPEAAADLGEFLFAKAWFDDESDPFGRAPSIINYDNAKGEQVTQDSRVWHSGLSDEGGAGAWLAAVMKNHAQPDPKEVAKLERFVNETVWGGIQFDDGPLKYGVKKSLFFYDPAALPNFDYTGDARRWRSWTSWDQEHAGDTGRGYNYPHVVAAYWTLYRLARDHERLATERPWEWYLEQAYHTTKFMTGGYGPRVGYVEMGLMDGTVFLRLLEDLRREGWDDKADEIEAAMRERAERWRTLEYPFGSEMAWDSTGQEEVYGWCKFFGFDAKADVTLNAILGYMPTVPHWGYNGNARRYWDFIYGGAPNQGIERQIHHYGSGLNAIPVLDAYRENPEDLYLLRVGFGGSSGAIAAIGQSGFPSAAFHSDPGKLRWDDYIGDYGPNLFGHAMTTGAYLVEHDTLGWLGFGGSVEEDGDAVVIRPWDTMRQRVYLAPLGLYLTLDSGRFESVRHDAASGEVTIALAPADEHTPSARLRVEQPATLDGVGTYGPTAKWEVARGAYVVPLKETSVTVVLRPSEAE